MASAGRRCWPARPSAAGPREPSGPASRSATRSWRSCSSSAAWSCTPPGWCWASRISARPGWRARPPSWPRAAAPGVGMRVRLDSVPLRDASLGPAEILMSESQERMMAIVEPAGLDRFLAHLREVGRPGHGDRRGHRHRAAGDDLARRAGRRHPAGQRGRPGPGLPAPGRACPPGQAALAGRRPVPAGPPGDGRGTARRRCCPLLGAPGRGRQELGDRAVRPLRAGRDGARDAAGRRPGPGRRADLARGRARGGRQRAVLPAGPVRGRAARAGRGLPQRGRDRGAAAGRHQLPQLRLAGGSRA